MILIIVGKNRVAQIKVKLSEWEKRHWVVVGTQQYKIYPNHLMRVVRTKYGRPIKDEEGMIYPENGAVPWHTDPEFFKMDKSLSEIDEHKLMLAESRVNIGSFIARAGKNLKGLSGAIPLLIGAFVFVYIWVF